MARFEAALARACSSAGVVPAAEADALARACEHARFDAAQLARDAREAGTLAIPFVKDLTRQVAAVSEEAARYVHLGATSQDVMDTAIVLCLREASGHIAGLSRRLGDALADLAQRHRRTPLAGRTLLQPALPVPLGWKVAGWLSMLGRSHVQFCAAASESTVLQFGGAAGTLSAYGSEGPAIASALAAQLGLGLPPISWHSARDRLARLGAASAVLAGAAGRVARDVSLLMQPEVGEAAEPAVPGRGGSSSLPHKRNPAACLLALEAAQRSPGLVATLLSQLTPEHERGLGQWQAQWFTLRDLLGASASALASMVPVAEGLQIFPDAMRANLARTRGLVYSEAVALRLSRAIGKQAAHALVERLCAEAVRRDASLEDVMRADPETMRIVPAKDLADLFRPEVAFGAAASMIDSVLAEWRTSRAAVT